MAPVSSVSIHNGRYNARAAICPSGCLAGAGLQPENRDLPICATEGRCASLPAW